MFPRLWAALTALFLLPLMAFGAADDIARLYNFTPGTPIQSSQVNAEFNQQVNTLNNKAGRGVANTFSGVNTFGAQVNVSALLNATGNATIAGVTTLNGIVNASNNVNITGKLNVARTTDPSTPANGDFWFNSTDGVYRLYAAATVTPLPTPALFPGYISGPAPAWATNNTVTVFAQTAVVSADRTTFIIPATNLTCNLSTSGANGLDTGTEAANTWYYLWLIRNNTTSTVACLFSTSSTAPTMPSGFTVRRRLPGAWRNDASSNLISQRYESWPYQAHIRYNVTPTSYNGTTRTASVTNVLVDGVATTDTTISLTSFVPPVSRQVELFGFTESSNGTFGIGPAGDTVYDYILSVNKGSSSSWLGDTQSFRTRTDASQAVEYIRFHSSGELGLDVFGYIDTQGD